MKELDWDKKLKIQTVGRDDFHADEHHYPYEPTPYEVLERLVESDVLPSTSQATPEAFMREFEKNTSIFAYFSNK
mgnify:CR=1 FL=1